MEDSTGRRPDTPAHLPDNHVIVGRVLGAWGLQGHLKVAPMSDAPRRFSQGSLLYLDGRPTRVISSRQSQGHLLLRLDSITDRTQAEAARNKLLTVAPEQVEPLPEGIYYHFQVLDMEVFDERGQRLGVVKEILPTGSNDVYVVQGDGQRELLIPAIRDVVLDVDVEGRRMIVRLPEAL